ncbi:MAG: hypothetical protein DMF85_10895, partial [Acidobacteria bacterium]
MPPRFAYWTIIVGDQPTAFRAARQDELLPTLRQLQSRHPDAVMKWFARLAAARRASRSARTVQGAARRQTPALRLEAAPRRQTTGSASPASPEEERGRVIAHIVLLKPRAEFTAEDRRRAIDAMSQASAAIPDVRRFRIGRRIRHGLPGYERQMRED